MCDCAVHLHLPCVMDRFMTRAQVIQTMHDICYDVSCCQTRAFLLKRFLIVSIHRQYTELYVRPSDPLFLLYLIQHGHSQGKRHSIAR